MSARRRLLERAIPLLPDRVRGRSHVFLCRRPRPLVVSTVGVLAALAVGRVATIGMDWPGALAVIAACLLLAWVIARLLVMQFRVVVADDRCVHVIEGDGRPWHPGPRPVRHLLSLPRSEMVAVPYESLWIPVELPDGTWWAHYRWRTELLAIHETKSG